MIFPDQTEWKGVFQPDRKGSLSDTQMITKSEQLSQQVYLVGVQGEKLSFSLGQYTTAFLTEISTIKKHIFGDINIHIYILSDSQAGLTALDSFQIIS